MSVKTLVEEFSTLEDPRCRGKVEHRLIDILVIAVCAVIAGAASQEDIALYGRSKVGWLGAFLALSNGIPAHDAFRRVFMLIDTGRFERCFEAWVRAFGAPVDQDVVAIDGKRPHGITDTWSKSSPASFMRNPCAWCRTRATSPSYFLARPHWKAMPEICTDAPGFDRVTLQSNVDVLAFFRAQLDVTDS